MRNIMITITQFNKNSQEDKNLVDYNYRVDNSNQMTNINRTAWTKKHLDHKKKTIGHNIVVGQKNDDGRWHLGGVLPQEDK